MSGVMVSLTLVSSCPATLIHSADRILPLFSTCAGERCSQVGSSPPSSPPPLTGPKRLTT